MAQAKLSDRDYAESKHQYTHPLLRRRVASVTSIVSAFDSGDKLGRGAMAAAKLERQGINYREEWNAKRDIGTRVHSYAHLWADGKTAEVPDEDGPWMDSFAAWCREVAPEWILTEAAGVGSTICLGCAGEGCGVCLGTGTLGFGGRFDAVGWWRDFFYLGDLKTGKSYRPELTIQLAGYANFDGLIIYDEDGRAVDLAPMPHLDRWCGIYIHADSCEMVECPDPAKACDDWTIEQMQAEAFQTFRSLLYVKEWAKQVNRKGR
jgi:hypothetical protein